MSHLIDTTVKENGDAYYADKPPWHRLGTVVEGARTSEEVKKLALDWEVEKRPIWTEGNALLSVGDDGEPVFDREVMRIPDTYATVRTDTDSVLGIVGSMYQVLQNAEAFDFMDELIDTGDVRYESAGSLKDGRVVWLLARLTNQDAEVVPGDVQVPYLLLSNSHDGSTAVRIQPTFVRVVCWNTLSLSLKEKRRGSAQFSIRHVGDIRARVEEARKVIGMVREGFAAYIDTAKDLARTEVSEDRLATYMQALFPQAFKDNASTRAKNVVKEILRSFAQDPRQNLQGIQRSAWSALQAVTQYYDHERNVQGRTAIDKGQARLHGAWFGDQATGKAKAFEQAKELLLV